MKDILKIKLVPLYEKMLYSFSEKEELYPFCMQWGKHFPFEQGSGILFVGKATNGWAYPTTDIKKVFLESGEGIFARNDQMEWVHSCESSINGYNSKKSAFWRVVKKVSQSLYGKEEWYSKVAWSNLYKMAPSSGNPSGRIRNKQIEACKLILGEEINALSPKYVVFLTSGWENAFIKHLFNSCESKPIQQLHWGSGFTSKAYLIDGITYITSPHPQGKREDQHVDAINKLISAIEVN